VSSRRKQKKRRPQNKPRRPSQENLAAQVGATTTANNYCSQGAGLFYRIRIVSPA
jgi:hypothetical protein